MDVPAVNVQWVEERIRQYRTADISVVISLDDGLLTPILRGVESKSVWEVAREVGGLEAGVG